MATPQNDPNNTGGKSFTSGVKSAAANLAGPAVQLASGASLLNVAGSALKDGVIGKLLGPTALFAGGLVGVVRTMKQIVDQTGLIEKGLRRISSVQQIQGKFETLLKSAEAATERMKELYNFTANSPFDFNDVAEANRILQTLSKGALAGSRGMRLVGDSAAAMGVPMAEAANRVGKLYAALKSGRSLDRVLFQLQAMGAVSDELAHELENLEQAGASFSEKFAVVEKHLLRTDGAMKAEMDTLQGLTKRIDEAGKVFAQAFGQPFVEAQARAMQNTLAATQNLTPLFAKIAQDVAPLLKFFTNIRNSIVESTLATKEFAAALGVAYEMAKALFIGLATGAVATFLGNIRKGITAVATMATSAKAAFATAAAGGGMLGKVLTGLTKALTFLKTLIVAIFANAAKTLMGALANPVVAAAVAAAAAAVAFTNWANSVSKAADELVEMITRLSKVRAEMKRVADEAKNMDQWRTAVAASDEAEKKTLEELEKLGERPSGTTVTTLGQDYKMRTYQQSADPAALQKYDITKSNLEHTLTAIRSARKKLNDNLPQMGPGQAGRDAIFANVGKTMQSRDAREQADIDRAGDPDKLRLMEARYRRIRGDIREGEANDAGRLEPEKYKGAPTELMIISRKIAELEKTGSVPASFYERQAELINKADTYRDKQAQTPQLFNEIKSLKEQIRLATGGVVSKRESNLAAIGNDPRRGRAYEDLHARDQLREEYRKMGLSEGAADEDFKNSILADAQRSGPRVTASSLQAIGGGGGSYGSDPMLAAQQRIEAYNRTSNEYLRIIAEASKHNSTGIQ